MSHDEPPQQGGGSWFRWGGMDLADPTAPADPDLAPGAVARAIAWLRGWWRWWMTVGLLAGLLLLAAVVEVAVVVELPGEVVDVATVVEVVDEAAGGVVTDGHSGAYLTTAARTSPTALDVALAVLRPSASLGPTSPPQVQGFAHLEVALLSGRGIAPGRADPEALGLRATVADGVAGPTSLAVLLEVVDATASVDLAAGRRILALGSLDAEGALGCQADPKASLDAAGSVDVVLLGTGCPPPAASGAEVLAVPGLADAVAALGPGR